MIGRNNRVSKREGSGSSKAIEYTKQEFTRTIETLELELDTKLKQTIKQK